MPALSLSRLQAILAEEEDETSNQPAETGSGNDNPPTAFELQTLAHTLLNRPIPDTLFRCPVSVPQTTIVPWHTLPRPLQQQVLEHHAGGWNVQRAAASSADDNMEVEIPSVYLEPLSWTDGEAAGNENNRPSPHPKLQGNLRDKLSEYTRGLTGQARPFRPGGGVQEDIPGAQEDPYRTPEVLARHDRLLQKWPSTEEETRALWKEGLFLTAPPGVQFDVGLSWDRVHGEEQEEAEPDTSVNNDKKEHGPSLRAEPTKHRHGADSVPTTSIFANHNASYFVENEIDSLFGSSSSGTESVYGEEEPEEEGLGPQQGNNKDKVEMDMTLLSQPSNDEEDDDDDDDDGAVEDIDALLSALTLPTLGEIGNNKTNESQTKLGDDRNPLTIAERQAQDQCDTSRKQWASTTLLPIQDFASYIPNPALTYPFVLDGFQQQAIARLERSENVFVAAHTSAGKTVVAEYAVALALQRATRCVYTSPIKALSNQKFRDFALKFGAPNVGLVTGDLQVNASDSTVLIMTTEILRSMLYRGADLIRDIEYVVFDECHYVNDSERGVVWEEVIIMLPAHVTLVFLSATTPNTLEFSDWIGRTKRKPVHVVKTDYRPVPLSFNLWAGNDLHKIMQGKSGFLEQGYRDAARALLPAQAKDPKKKDDPRSKTKKPVSGAKAMVWQQQGDRSKWLSLVKYLDRYVMTPTVVFSFSKKKCEEIARMLQSVDLNTAKERSAVQGFTIQAVSRLSQNDAKLPQVQMVCEMVQRGIGIHHGGLLPLLKECVEILFSRNLIKILLATETFAMGVNMPAKAVVFNSIRKHDGTAFRQLEPGEMTQMAGRAGRRGLDDVGTVIICCFGEEPPPENILRQVLTGSSTRLQSQFRLTYNMILNLLRVEEMSVESMIKRSFSEFATQRALTANNFPHLLVKGRRTLAKLEKQADAEAADRVGAEDLEEYFACSKQLLAGNRELLEAIQETDSASFKNLFVIGRVILVTAARNLGVVRESAVVLKLPEESGRHGQTGKSTSSNSLICMILLPTSYDKNSDSKTDTTAKSGMIGYVGDIGGRFYSIQKISLGQVLLVLDRKIKLDARDILKEGNRGGRAAGGDLFARPGAADMFAGMKAVGKNKQDDPFSLGRPTSKSPESALDKAMEVLREVEEKEIGSDGLAAADMKAHVQRGTNMLKYRELCQQIEVSAVQLRSFASHIHPTIEKYYLNLERKDSLQDKVNALQHFLSNESLALFPDFLQRKMVLQRLGYLNNNDTVYFNGRVACEVNTCEELIATEMVFEGILNELKPAEIAAALSALVFQEKSSDSSEELDSELPETLVECCEKMKTIATNLGQVQKDAGLQIDPGEYREASLKFGLVHVVYEWALGVTFKNICQLTGVQEGSIVRCITRLDELCREIRNCARVVGNPSLYRKLEAASEAIKRDVVFASSLYVS